MADQNTTIENEIWKAIPGFPGYEVSDQGRVRSYWKKRQRKYCLNQTVQTFLTPFGHPYLYISLFRDGKRFRLGVHQVVLTTFIGPCPAGMEGCHNDGNKTNNFLINLRWDTHSNNLADRIAHGTANKGEKHGAAKLNKTQVIQIRELASQGYTMKMLGAAFHICPQNANNIVLRKSWKHIA